LDRLAAVSRVREVLGQYAWILDHHTLGDVWMTIHFELRPGHAAELIEALRSIGGLKVWTEDDRPLPVRDDPELCGENLDVEPISGALQIYFANEAHR
jgi:hypothetical protein